MIHWRGLLPWVSRAWPVLALLPVGFVHFLTLRLLPAETVMVNKLWGMFLQVLGGLLVLYSVNDNLGLFRAQSLASTVTKWFKEFPIKRKPVSVRGTASGSMSFNLNASGTVGRAHSTVEEHIAILEQMLQDLQKQLQLEVKTINTRIETVRNDFQKQIADTTNKITDISTRLEHAAVGGFKFQILGVLLAIYGALTSVFA
jgi:hypothetical protein